MNKQIQQLAKQAYEDVIKNTPSFLVTKELYEQKFAELIVRECVEKCVYVVDRQEILAHFGVEE